MEDIKKRGYTLSGVYVAFWENHNKEAQERYYFKEKMINENLIIVDEYYNDRNYNECLLLKHFNQLYAIEYCFYDGSNLDEIQKYRILKDVFELYNKLSLIEFLETMHMMSGSIITASMKSNSEFAEKIKNNIGNIINTIVNDAV